MTGCKLRPAGLLVRRNPRQQWVAKRIVPIPMAQLKLHEDGSMHLKQLDTLIKEQMPANLDTKFDHRTLSSGLLFIYYYFSMQIITFYGLCSENSINFHHQHYLLDRRFLCNFTKQNKNFSNWIRNWRDQWAAKRQYWKFANCF